LITGHSFLMTIHRIAQLFGRHSVLLSTFFINTQEYPDPGPSLALKQYNTIGCSAILILLYLGSLRKSIPFNKRECLGLLLLTVLPVQLSGKFNILLLLPLHHYPYQIQLRWCGPTFLLLLLSWHPYVLIPDTKGRRHETLPFSSSFC